MKRIFPTTLQVRNDRDEVSEDEKHKGYFDESSRDADLIIGVYGNKIHICCPQYWYRTFTFNLNTDTCFLPEVQLEEGEVMEGNLMEVRIRYAMWKLIALVIKTECGRSALYELPENFIRISHLSRKQAKQIYYLFKHVFDREHVEYQVKSSWRSFYSKKWDIPDIRIKAKRRRKGARAPL